MKATLLTCNLSPQKATSLRVLALRLGLQVKPIPAEQADHTLSQLLFGLTDPAIPSTPDFSGELLIMAGLTGKTLDLLLQGLRRQRVHIPLKAVLTETNASWTLVQLYEELCRERDAFAAGESADHSL